MKMSALKYVPFVMVIVSILTIKCQILFVFHVLKDTSDQNVRSVN